MGTLPTNKSYHCAVGTFALKRIIITIAFFFLLFFHGTNCFCSILGKPRWYWEGAFFLEPILETWVLLFVSLHLSLMKSISGMLFYKWVSLNPTVLNHKLLPCWVADFRWLIMIMVSKWVFICHNQQLWAYFTIRWSMFEFINRSSVPYIFRFRCIDQRY